MTVPLIRPDISFDEVRDDVRQILDSGTLTNGPYVARFEAAMAEAVGVAHAVTTTSATTALHLALAALDIGPGDEVLVSDFTFPASGNVVVQLGATPVLVDSKPDSFALDVADAEAKVSARTRAIMTVDPFGQPADLDAVMALADRHDLVVVEDAACALGSRIGDRSCGAWPAAGCFSFHPRKVVTTGEGGAVTTDDDALAERLRRLRNHGGVRSEVGMGFAEPGFNYRLAEIPAAMGLAQLRRFDAILADRRATAERYNGLLANVGGVEVRRPASHETWSYQSYVVMLDDSIDRDAVITVMRDRGFETTLGTYAMHAQDAFRVLGYQPGDLPRSYRAQQQSLTLPIVPNMPVRLVEGVVEALERAIEECSAHV